ncbi:MAG: ATP-dependent metallopeptidase FtsH/Yme1/Tma family protein, partial [Rhodoblastus sp.]|nr:ATP-dependent metallopeptidase FtsH/Yme1/Tma family protein [Rhodoblastus sp.]
MNPNFRNFALWVIIFFLVVALVMLFQNPAQRQQTSAISFSELLTQVDQGRVRDVTIAGNDISGHYTDGRDFSTYAPSDPTLVQTLYKKNVAITARPPSEGNNWLVTMLVNGLPLI